MTQEEGKKIYCQGCNIYLGLIRDATLKKKMVFLCKHCETKRKASDMAKRFKRKNDPYNIAEQLFGSFNAKKR